MCCLYYLTRPRDEFKKQMDQWRADHEEELKKLEGQLDSAQRQLGNEQFLGKAPAHVVEGLRRQAADNELLAQKIRAALGKLG